uniref:Radical SAM superfamily protein n=1 Tax=viral metagenome TaxID=1070528 RepID=A0A6H1ZRS6_9ZZZZ
MNNMYDWIGTTWNPLAGECQHNCIYCYVNSLRKRNKTLNDKYSSERRLVEKEFKNLGKDKMIFVCSCNDLFARNVPIDFISRVLYHCRSYQDNEYLFQTKNTEGFIGFKDEFPKNTILGTTLETNRFYDISFAPRISERQYYIKRVAFLMQNKPKIMITCEPILDFDLDEFVGMIRTIQPDWVNIGADSKNHGLPEPSYPKVLELIEALKGFTEVRRKSNLERLK